MTHLENIRAEFDKIDANIVQLFEQRMRLSALVAAEKQQRNIPIENKDRENEILARVGQKVAPELATYTQALFTTLFDLSKSYQMQLQNQHFKGLAAQYGSKSNIILIGMPGAGKSSVALALAKICGWPVYDTDTMIIKQVGKSIAEIFADEGEAIFRSLEQQMVTEATAQRNCIISCGGGAPLNADNQDKLRASGKIYWLKRSLELLAIEGRPLSVNLDKLHEQRQPIYAALADYAIDNDGTIEDAAQRIWELHGVI